MMSAWRPALLAASALLSFVAGGTLASSVLSLVSVRARGSAERAERRLARWAPRPCSPSPASGPHPAPEPHRAIEDGMDAVVSDLLAISGRSGARAARSCY